MTQGDDTGAVATCDTRFETAEDPRIPESKSYFKIGEVAKITGLKAYVLRYWESEFPWIRPTKTSAGQRLYRRQDVAFFLKIKRLRYDGGQTIQDAKNSLREAFDKERKPRAKSPRQPLSGAPAKSAPRIGSMTATQKDVRACADELQLRLDEMRAIAQDLLRAADR